MAIIIVHSHKGIKEKLTEDAGSCSVLIIWFDMCPKNVFLSCSAFTDQVQLLTCVTGGMHVETSLP